MRKHVFWICYLPESVAHPADIRRTSGELPANEKFKLPCHNLLSFDLYTKQVQSICQEGTQQRGQSNLKSTSKNDHRFNQNMHQNGIPLFFFSCVKEVSVGVCLCLDDTDKNPLLNHFIQNQKRSISHKEFYFRPHVKVTIV